MTDYERIEKAIFYISAHLHSQPRLDEIAAHLHLSPFHFQRMFCRWAGVTPKRFLQVLTLERAKQLLRESKSLLEVSNSLGLSSGSRLYDHFVQLEAVTPGEYKKEGVGLSIGYGVHNTPFGPAFIAITPRGICKFSFLQGEAMGAHLADLCKKWPYAVVHEEQQATLEVLDGMFGVAKKPNKPISLHVAGTNFQVSVWKALLQIPPAAVVSYSQIAKAVGRPSAARAVGTAIGSNPVAFLIPCHRVIQQGGKLGGYYWGEARKHAIHAWESARYEGFAPEEAAQAEHSLF
ncbi:methylated-DNA--[protein]-cysteine S-methyltransferase [Iodobacter fluviatilis]|uniref:methylated-DNA--[protein]-cysteine S-methyltransferase n=1 Tax=Iodobacter fluviatilis TaxID=537 RepID=A0A377Q763_9NEIS|nr:methylated-DNA--[protein]-cysteine S-methyltransferase [Iodobacter fluviatilis]TCU89322.1 AraC family transcriptional regulator of adaptative response/methylated-DNA-[protein]-cysteine methyltransferase [Iodobacter fluviatilis]STQ90692.1 Regulatory protein of adaptative response [Iodobacter fluviatilis]